MQNSLIRHATIVGLLAGVPTGRADAQGLVSPYPDVGPGTSLFDHEPDIAALPEKEWFRSNIPFVDVPDRNIMAVYYYRWRVWYESQRNTGPSNGWITTEFEPLFGFGGPFESISAASGHHIDEGRWIRDRRYLDQYIDFWLKGTGSQGKGTAFNPVTADWLQAYTNWLPTAVVDRARVTGDWSFATQRLPQLETAYAHWAPLFNASLDLYFVTPIWDAMENSASSNRTDPSNPFSGGDGYRPTINAYLYSDSLAIAELALRTGNLRTTLDYAGRAFRIQQATEKHLWDPASNFYKHVPVASDPGLVPIPDREEIGFVPWQFDLPSPSRSIAWSQLTQHGGFAGLDGITTVERRSPYYYFQATTGCCHWDGPVWPYATSQTLTGLANLLIDYPAQPYVTAQTYYDELHVFAASQFKDGLPYVAEAHDADTPAWIYDTPNRSEDYNHSTFGDLVLTGLLGIRPEGFDAVLLHPLAPKSWDWYAVDNAPYHGHNLSFSWDRDGSHYGHGAGFRVYIDGNLVGVSMRPGPELIAFPPAVPQTLPVLVDDAANADVAPFPHAAASYTGSDGDPSRAIDGKDFFLTVPNTRWVNTGSPNAQDWLSVDFGAPRPVSDVRVFLYADGQVVRAPQSYVLQQRNADGSWSDIPNQRRTPNQPAGDDLNRVSFPTIQARRIRVLMTPQPGYAVGVTEIQSWREVGSIH